jgi:hypothetical protein
MRETDLVIRTPGALDGDIVIDYLKGCRCGDVRNGIAAHWSRRKPRGGFVISFEDLERVYLAALEARERKAPR